MTPSIPVHAYTHIHDPQSQPAPGTGRMVKVVPFKAYRPPPNMAASLAAPPYDVIDSDEARRMADGNEHSFLRVRFSMLGDSCHNNKA